MAKETKQVLQKEQHPQSGGSYIRNKDGSLVKNKADAKKTNLAEKPADQTKE